MIALMLVVLPLLGVSDPRPSPPPAPAMAAPAPSWDGDEIHDYLDRQHAHTLSAVDDVLRRLRPAYPEPKERRLAMLALDEALHYDEPDSNASPAVREFLKTRLALAAREIEKTKVREGAVIWKLYNHSFVVKTASVTLAFDVTRTHWGSGGGQPEIEDAIGRIVSQCDVLFLSHNHGDHVDDWVRDRFLAEGKPIVAPEDIHPGEARVMRPVRDASIRRKVALKSGRTIEVAVFPGFQGELTNNVYLVFAPEGMSFAHTGDLFRSKQTQEDMLQWIDRVKDRWKVDVLMVNVWTSDFARTMDGFDARMVITGHENEMGHDPLKRKTNYLAYDRLRDSPRPWVVMTWGESYYYKRSGSSAAR